ncbi:MAG: VWA domain-containing protein [Bdellovibrionales bacterium]|nr:VWA domain-containing protein [Bdellovibrionales bacterium]
MKCIHLFLTTLFILPLSVLADLPQPEEANKVIIVLDASGSMWGQINAEPKIGIAKSVVRDLVRDWDPSIELGLTVYGHRKKGDCADIEALVPVSHVQPGQIESKLNSINPKGKTPLSQAVIQAADELKYTEQKATVILVSDGIETCDYDPCEVARKLEASGIDFTTHVIGFDIQEQKAKDQLKCLAENTGGRFLAANDAASLKSSLDEAVKEVARANTNNVHLFAVHHEGGTPLENVSWQVFQVAKPDSNAVAYGRGPTPDYHLEPGHYIAKVKSVQGKASASKEFEVPAEGELKQEVVLPLEGTVKLVAVNEAGGEPLSDVTWTVNMIAENNELGKTVTYGKGAQPEYTLLPGKYFAEVKSQGGKATARQEIEVRPSENNTIEVVLSQEGIIKLVAVNEPGGKPLNAVNWRVNSLDTETEKGKNVTYGKGAQPEYKLLPGKYTALVSSNSGKASAEQEIEVIAGKKTTTEVVMAAEGILELAAVHQAGGKPLSDVYWEIFTIAPKDSIENPKRVTYGKGAQPSYKLLPGKYLAKVRSRNGMADIGQEVEVKPLKKNRIEVLFPQEGEIQLSAITTEGHQPERISWEVYTLVEADSIEQPERLKFGGGKTPKYRMLPGKYMARATYDQKKYEKEIEVIPGKITKEELTLSQEG